MTFATAGFRSGSRIFRGPASRGDLGHVNTVFGALLVVGGRWRRWPGDGRAIDYAAFSRIVLSGVRGGDLDLLPVHYRDALCAIPVGLGHGFHCDVLPVF